MCGLMGGSGRLNSKVLVTLGCLNARRGTDSAGIGWADESGLNFQKTAAHPAVAFNLELAEGIEKAAAAGVAVGHTRAATTGAATDKNAHPFLIDGILFAHNGIISNYATFGRYDVDSMALIHGIKERNFSKYEGSVALLWIEGTKLFAYRKGNPLFRGLKDGALYLASEKTMLEGVGCRKVRELAEAHIYEIAGGGIVKSTKVPANKSTTVVYGYSNYDGYDWRNNRWEETRIDPKPDDKAECKCGHKGGDHSQTHATTRGWACYSKEAGSGHYCPCNKFSPKEESGKPTGSATSGPSPSGGEVKMPVEALDKCRCGHGVLRHTARGGIKSCDVTKCPCLNYNEERRDVVDVSRPPAAAEAASGLEAWDDVHEKALCECNHEREYHKGGPELSCYVAHCGCPGFWPLLINGSPVMETPTGDVVKVETEPVTADGLPGWDESWRNKLPDDKPWDEEAEARMENLNRSAYLR